MAITYFFDVFYFIPLHISNNICTHRKSLNFISEVKTLPISKYNMRIIYIYIRSGQKL